MLLNIFFIKATLEVFFHFKNEKKKPKKRWKREENFYFPVFNHFIPDTQKLLPPTFVVLSNIFLWSPLNLSYHKWNSHIDLDDQVLQLCSHSPKIKLV